MGGATEQKTRLRIQATSTIKSDGAPERSRNLKNTCSFAEAWAEGEFVQAPLAQIGVSAASVQKVTLRESAHL
jgi:hypothetical protein